MQLPEIVDSLNEIALYEEMLDDLRAVNADLDSFNKWSNDTLTSIRNALGQLMEYSYYPNNKRADKIKIVSHAPVNESIRNYIKHVRNEFEIPLYYIQFNFHDGKLIEEI